MAIENPSFIQSEPRGSCLVVTILEQQMRNFEKVTQIKLEILSAVQEFLPKVVVLDLSRVNFVGSVGFLAFLAIRREPGVENVVLCNLDPNVHKLFSISKLILEGSSASAPLQVSESVEKAVAMQGRIADEKA